MSLSIRNSLEPTIREAIIAASGFDGEKVIFHYPNAPRPDFPYIGIKFMNRSQVINDWQVLDIGDELLHQYGNREVVFTITCYGDGAIDTINALDGSIYTQNVRTILEQASAAVLRSQIVFNDYVLVNSHWEERAKIDITFNCYVENGSTTEDVGVFESADVTWENKL